MVNNHKIILFSSHTIDEEQRLELLNLYRVNEVIYLPEELQKIWSNVYLDEKYYTNMELLVRFMLKTLNEGDYIVAQGNWGYVYRLVTVAKENNIIPLYAFTLRDGEDKIINGEKVRISKFKHVKFVEYN